MNWLRSHPYVAALSVTGILLLIGAYIVQRQAAGPIHSQTTAWGGAGAPLLNPTSYLGDSASNAAGVPQNQENIMQNVKNGPPYTYIPPGTLAPVQSTAKEGSFDFDAFVAMLSSAGGGSASGGKKTSGTNASATYSFIPSGLMSTTTPDDSRTETEQLLYDYGNEIGSYIQSFEEQHPGVTQILKNQVEDRDDPEKAAAVVSLANALKRVGENLTTMDRIATQMASPHARLAKSYIAIGTNLALIPKAESDSDFIKAIETYNASADTFVRNYVAVAELFGAYGITFTLTDAGSVFTFTPTGL